MVYHSTEYSSLCLKAGIFVYPSYVSQFASANLKPPIHPFSTPLPLGNQKFILYVCIYFCFIDTFVSHFRFHVQLMSYAICLFLSDLLYSMLPQMA